MHHATIPLVLGNVPVTKVIGELMRLLHAIILMNVKLMQQSIYLASFMHVTTTPLVLIPMAITPVLVILDMKVMDLTALISMNVPIAISDLSLKPTVMPTPHVPTLTVPTNALVMTGITATVLTAKTQMNVPLLVRWGTQWCYRSILWC